VQDLLLVIDDAHLFVRNPGAYNALIDLVDKSHRTSGAKGVKLLLLTGDRFEERPMDLIKLINLCKPREARLPSTEDKFADKYLDATKTVFTEKGKAEYRYDVSGYVSRFDARWDMSKHSSVKQINRVIAEISRTTDAGSPARIAKCVEAMKTVQGMIVSEGTQSTKVLGELRQAQRTANTSERKTEIFKDIQYEKTTNEKFTNALQLAMDKLKRMYTDSKQAFENNNSQEGALAKVLGKKRKTASADNIVKPNKVASVFNMFKPTG
jgi:hypothetical protein